ncbi:MAG: hypothetical protein EOP94_00295 [Zymomonas sp.]|nr:MAG: hypothetical protein EOP94_00295 [Zymomonas sp.]
MGEHTNDNREPPRSILSRRHTRRAMTGELLFESLLYVLVERSIMTKSDAKEVIQVVIDVTHEIAADHGRYRRAEDTAVVRLDSMLAGIEALGDTIP